MKDSCIPAGQEAGRCNYLTALRFLVRREVRYTKYIRLLLPNSQFNDKIMKLKVITTLLTSKLLSTSK